MLALWLSFFAVVAFSGLAKLVIGDGEHLRMLALFAVLLHVLITIPILAIDRKDCRGILVLGFLLRVVTMFWDMFGRSIAMVPHAGMDDHGYMMGAIEVARDLSLLGERIYGGLYPKTMAMVVYFSGAGDVFVHYLNVLFGISTVLLIYKSLKLMNISERATKVTMIIVALFPQNIFFSGITLRESWITFLIAFSLYSFLRWCIFGKLGDSIVSTFFVCWASAYHSGVIFVLFGYLFVYLFYYRRTNKLNFNKQTIVMFVLFTGLGILVYSQFSDLLLGNKFGNVSELELTTIYERSELSLGSSAYLTGVEITSFTSFVMFAPLKMFYFLTSPLPHNWRGLADLIAFFLDSLFYIFTIYYSVRYFKSVSSRHKFALGLLLSIILMTFVFGVSTGNTGTAIRHRHKIFPLVAVLCALVIEFRQDIQPKIGRH